MQAGAGIGTAARAVDALLSNYHLHSHNASRNYSSTPLHLPLADDELPQAASLELIAMDSTQLGNLLAHDSICTPPLFHPTPGTAPTAPTAPTTPSGQQHSCTKDLLHHKPFLPLTHSLAEPLEAMPSLSPPSFTSPAAETQPAGPHWTPPASAPTTRPSLRPIPPHTLPTPLCSPSPPPALRHHPNSPHLRYGYPKPASIPEPPPPPLSSVSNACVASTPATQLWPYPSPRNPPTHAHRPHPVPLPLPHAPHPRPDPHTFYSSTHLHASTHPPPSLYRSPNHTPSPHLSPNRSPDPSLHPFPLHTPPHRTPPPNSPHARSPNPKPHHPRPTPTPTPSPPAHATHSKPRRKKLRPTDTINSLQRQVDTIATRIDTLTLRNHQLHKRSQVLNTFVQTLTHLESLTTAADTALAHHRTHPNPAAPPKGAAAFLDCTPEQYIALYHDHVAKVGKWIMQVEGVAGVGGGGPSDEALAELQAANKELVEGAVFAGSERADFVARVVAELLTLAPGTVPEEEHWAEVLPAMDLSEGQVEDLLVAREVFLRCSENVSKEQHAVKAALQQHSHQAPAVSSTLGVPDDEHITRLGTILRKQQCLASVLFFFVFHHTLTPMQVARALVNAYPLLPDPVVILNALHALRGQAPGAPSLLPANGPLATARNLSALRQLAGSSTPPALHSIHHRSPKGLRGATAGASSSSSSGSGSGVSSASAGSSGRDSPAPMDYTQGPSRPTLV